MPVKIVILQTSGTQAVEREVFERMRLKRGTECIVVDNVAEAKKYLSEGKLTGQFFITGTDHGHDIHGTIQSLRTVDPTLIVALYSSVGSVEGDFDYIINKMADSEAKDSLKTYILLYLHRLRGKKLKSKYAKSKGNRKIQKTNRLAAARLLQPELFRQ